MLPYPGEPPAAAADLAALYRRLGIYRDTATPSAPANTAGSKPHGISVGPQEAAGMFSRQVSQGMLAWAEDLTRNAGTPEGKGSNNWVVAGTRTVSGKPLLANDPHLGLSAPAIWYFARLQAPASVAVDGTAIGAMDAIGATLPGLPFVVLGRTDSVAWGFTNTGPDVQDLYLEQINPADPGQYRTPAARYMLAYSDVSQKPEQLHVKVPVGRTLHECTQSHVTHDFALKLYLSTKLFRLAVISSGVVTSR